MPSGTELATAYVQIVPSAQGIKGKITEALGGEPESAGKIAGKAIMSGIGATVRGLGKIIGDSIVKGGDLEQAIGGVKSLLGDDMFEEVNKKAQKAATELQITSTQYMNQVTSFSGKLLQDLDGNTEAVVEAADKAIQSMSDNANKMGTDIADIQNAYQGFAKGNFTMLDNLKLGYGGTKTEMERLLADAEAIRLKNGEMVDYSIDSFADMIEAIKVVQEEYGIAGTSAEEAKTTISGSMKSLSASWDDFVANLSLGTDIQPSLDNLYAAVTNTANQIIPAVLSIMETLPGALLDLVVTLGPGLAESGIQAIVGIITGLNDKIPALMPVMVSALNTICNTLVQNLPLLVTTAGQLILGLGRGLVQSIPSLVKQIPAIIQAIVKGIVDFVPDLLKAGSDLMTGLANGIGNSVANVVKKAKEAASKILNSVKNFFGIHSPSTVFAEMGEMLDMGLAEGVEDNIKPVQKAMNKLATATTGNMQSSLSLKAIPARPTSGSGLGVVNINVYPSAGMDEYALAQKVSDVINKQIISQRKVWA